jgi:carboxyl-terminal processing protease
MNFADSIKHTNEKKYTTKSGDTLYDGGGITPDVFVGYDTTAFDKPLMRALLSGSLNRFVYLNYLQNRDEFNKYKNSKDFANNYQVDEATLNRFKEFAKQDSITFNFNNQIEKEHLAKQIKVLTASQLFRSEGFYEANNKYDDMMKKALEILKPQANIISTK